jgi:hypothetical protein
MSHYFKNFYGVWRYSPTLYPSIERPVNFEEIKDPHRIQPNPGL